MRGASLLADNDTTTSGFGTYLRIMHPSEDWPHFVDVAQFNQQAATDTVNAEWAYERVYVSLDAVGGWWWRENLGLGSYTDQRYGYTVKVEPYHYELTLKPALRQRPREAWYQRGTRWSSLTIPPE